MTVLIVMPLGYASHSAFFKNHPEVMSFLQIWQVLTEKSRQSQRDIKVNKYSHLVML